MNVAWSLLGDKWAGSTLGEVGGVSPWEVAGTSAVPACLHVCVCAILPPQTQPTQDIPPPCRQSQRGHGGRRDVRPAAVPANGDHGRVRIDRRVQGVIRLAYCASVCVCVAPCRGVDDCVSLLCARSNRLLSFRVTSHFGQMLMGDQVRYQQMGIMVPVDSLVEFER